MLVSKEKEAPASDRAPLAEMEITESKVARIDAFLKLKESLKQSGLESVAQLVRIAEIIKHMHELNSAELLFEIESYISGVKSFSKKLDKLLPSAFPIEMEMSSLMEKLDAKDLRVLMVKMKGYLHGSKA